jgi:hypothetical protein
MLLKNTYKDPAPEEYKNTVPSHQECKDPVPAP